MMRMLYAAVGMVTSVATGLRRKAKPTVAPQPISLFGLNFTPDDGDDPFIPVGGILLVKGVREDRRGDVYREYYTPDLSLMERVGMTQSAADSCRDHLVQGQRRSR